MTDQQQELDFSQQRALARGTDPDTSHASATQFPAARLDALVYAVIVAAGERGCTLDDLEDALPDWRVVSLSPRPARLQENGWIEVTGERRPGRSGRLQRVVRAISRASERTA
jgi:hypothetical protein